MRVDRGKVEFAGDQEDGTDPEQFRQRVRICCSTCELDHVTLFHGVSPVLIDLFGDNKSTRYAAFFQTLKHQIQLYLVDAPVDS